MGAPAGLNDWYLRSSYRSYLDGAGSHPGDFYGAQMSRLASTLDNAEDLDDIILTSHHSSRGFAPP